MIQYYAPLKCCYLETDEKKYIIDKMLNGNIGVIVRWSE